MKVSGEYTGPLTIKKRIKQTGKGKGNAVREGFAEAEGELLTILDADLTMPPQLMPRFYEAYLEGHGEIINGSRLLYPMEGEAMRTLNWFGNVFFAKALSYVLGIRLSDSLCGTKLIDKTDYQRMVLWREEFGDFDPVGDFEILFPAAALGLKVIDIPIRYKDRTYGETNISRFSHGLMLFKNGNRWPHKNKMREISTLNKLDNPNRIEGLRSKIDKKAGLNSFFTINVTVL